MTPFLNAPSPTPYGHHHWVVLQGHDPALITPCPLWGSQTLTDNFTQVLHSISSENSPLQWKETCRTCLCCNVLLSMFLPENPPRGCAAYAKKRDSFFYYSSIAVAPPQWQVTSSALCVFGFSLSLYQHNYGCCKWEGKKQSKPKMVTKKKAKHFIVDIVSYSSEVCWHKNLTYDLTAGRQTKMEEVVLPQVQVNTAAATLLLTNT